MEILLNALQKIKNTIMMKKKKLLFFTAMTILLAYIQACKTGELVEPENKKLTLHFSVVYKNSGISFTDQQFITKANDTIVPTEFKILFSKIALIRSDNTDLAIDNVYGFVNFKKSANTIVLDNIPKGAYIGLKFWIGLDSAINYGDPSVYEATHPLNPNVNGMHWNWAGGYIFSLHEGTYLNKGISEGYSYHIATPRFANQITIPFYLPFDKTWVEAHLYVKADMEKYFSSIHNYSIKTEGAGSHSNPAQANIIDKLNTNIQTIFSVTK